MNKIRRGNGWPTSKQEKLLKACLLSGFEAHEAWIEWKNTTVIERIDPASYKLLPLVACNPDLRTLQDPLLTKCRWLHRQTLITNRLHFEKSMPLLSQLLKSGIDKIVLLKGIAMIVGYYKDFGARVIGDIDLLIPRSNAETAVSILLSTGWRSLLPRLDVQCAEQLDRWHAVNFVHKEGMNIDLHWSLSLESSAPLDSAVLQAAVPLAKNPLTLYLPNPGDLLLQTCIHGIKQCRVPLIRWVADALVLLKQSEKEIDWDRLVYLARQSHLCLSLSAAFDYLINRFNAPIPSSVVTDLDKNTPTSLEIREYWANARGYKNLAGWHRFCLKRGHLSAQSQLLHIHQYLQFSSLVKSPWQLPFFGLYWVFTRSIRYLFRKSLHLLKFRVN